MRSHNEGCLFKSSEERRLVRPKYREPHVAFLVAVLLFMSSKVSSDSAYYIYRQPAIRSIKLNPKTP